MKQKIYLMKNDFGLHKIGISLNPKKRAMEVSNSSGVPTEVVSVWESYNAYATEQRLHKHFSAKRKSGEWFKFTKKDIAEVENFIRLFDGQIDVTVNYNRDIGCAYKNLPCLDIKSMLTKPKLANMCSDIEDFIKSDYEILNRLFKKDKDAYFNLVEQLILDGYYIDPSWRKGCLNMSGKSCDLCSIGYRAESYPICLNSEKLRMELINVNAAIEDLEYSLQKKQERISEIMKELSGEK